jgi:hypothetical protein
MIGCSVWTSNSFSAGAEVVGQVLDESIAILSGSPGLIKEKFSLNPHATPQLLYS